MYRRGKSTAETRAAKPEATKWKSHVSATIRHVRSRFGSLYLDLPLRRPTDSWQNWRRPAPRAPPRGNRLFLKQNLSLLPSSCLLATTAPRACDLHPPQPATP